MKLNKETAREKFRASVNIKDINVFDNLDPNYEYKQVCANFYEGLGRIDRYIDAGWEVVYSTDKLKDDRSTSAKQDGKESDLRQSPVSTTTRSGKTMILMRCLKTQREKNEIEKAKIRKAQFEAKQNLKVDNKKKLNISSEVNSNSGDE